MWDILRGFAPWIIYFAFSDPERAQLGAIFAVVLTLVLGWPGLKRRKLLDWVTLLFFVALSFMLSLNSADIIARYAFVAAGLTLAATALGSVAVGRPFTLQYAQDTVPQEQQSSPIYFTINRGISTFWGISFLLQATLSALYLNEIGSATLMNEILPNTLTLATIIFTARFPNWYVARFTHQSRIAKDPNQA